MSTRNTLSLQKVETAFVKMLDVTAEMLPTPKSKELERVLNKIPKPHPVISGGGGLYYFYSEGLHLVKRIRTLFLPIT